MILSLACAINSLRWSVPAACMLSPAPVLFSLVQFTHCLLRPILRRETLERIDEGIWESYQRLVLFFFGSCTGAEIILSGDYESFLNSRENSVVISNHQSAVDWIIMDMLSLKQGLLGRMRFVLKDELKFIPMFGLYFWQHNCVTVGRFGSFNESRTTKQLAYMKQHSIPTWMIIFPEGTRYNPDNSEAISKSQQFAKNNGLNVLHHVLSPRAKAMQLALQHLESHIDVVYNVTVAYGSTHSSNCGNTMSRHRAPGMRDFITSNSPVVHVHIEEIRAKDIPREEQTFGSWIHQLFEGKDKILAQFYSTGKLTDKKVMKASAATWSQTLPVTIAMLTMTGAVLATPAGRVAYVASFLAGSVLSMTFMAFH